jgi:hypothetical protein
MNCLEVETILTDLACNQALEVQARDSALEHLAQCRRCADRLAAEHELTYELLAWNAASIKQQAPPAVEEKLRAAFRSRTRRPWLKIAAIGSIAAALLLFKLLAPQPHTEVPIAPATVITKAGIQVGTGDSPVQTKKKRQANRLPHRPHPFPAQIPAEAEVSTEFLPVAQGDGWTPLDGGRLVRVGLPRSAMSAFGLPVDQARTPERVQADVMLSDDGLLRAIRFVK